MFILGVNQFLRNIRRNILSIVQLSLVYIISLCTVSAYMGQFGLWHGISDYIDESGVVLWQCTPAGCDHIVEKLVKVEKCNIKYTVERTIKEKNVHYVLYTTNPDQKSYKVPIISGWWCESGRAQDGVIRAVVSDVFLEKNPDCKVGSIVSISDLKIKITGIYDSSELIFKDSAHSSEISYLDFYTTAEHSQAILGANTIYLMASYEDMFRESTPYLNGSVIIDYEDDITEKEYLANQEILMKEFEYYPSLNMEETKGIYEYSMDLLEVKLMPMLLIFLISLLFSIVSVTTSGVVNVYAEQRNYGIYFICGNSWKKSILLSVIQWGIAAGIALFISLLGYSICKATDLAHSFELTFSIYHVLVLLALTGFILLISAILPYRILKKMQPINILKNNL